MRRRNTLAINNAWLIPIVETLDAEVQVFCLPYAGGNASIFNYWRSMIADGVSVYAVELPGRQRRILDKPYTEMFALAQEAASSIARCIDRDFVLFGNCIGSVIAFEIAHKLREMLGREPLCLIASNARAPNIPRPELPVHALSEEDLIVALTRMGVTSLEILANKNVLRYLLPCLRADFSVVETYVYYDRPRLHCPIFAIAGASDPVVAEIHVDEWSKFTMGHFQKLVVPGDHNLLANQTVVLLNTIKQLMSALLEGRKVNC